MKKRLLSALLALALVFVLLPTTALAEVTTENDYDISINGKGWKFERDNTSGAYIPAYYYHTNEFSANENYRKLYTNDNLMLTKEGNTVTITIRRGTSHDHRNYPIEFTLKKESIEKNDVPCIKMGNDNNLVITGKGTLNITRNESKSYGAALYSNVGDITINGGITVNVSFLNGKDYYNKNASSNAIYVGDNHNLTVSGSGTNVTATNQGFDSSPATVCVEGGTITVSGGASLSATNTYADNFSGSSVTQHFKSYAISGTESKPCTLIVADEKSSVTAWAYDEKYGKPFGFVTYNITGATVKAGSSAYYATETNIDNINGKEYVKISVPALETTADVLIAKENAVVGVRTSLGEGNGYYTYNKDTKTLTLEDVSITNVAHFIQFWAKDSYTIELKGTNTITGVTSAIRVPEKGYNNESLDGLNVTITGTGSLNVTANTYAIDMQVGNLIFNSTGNITLTTNTNYKVQSTVCNALHVAGSISIDNAKYDIVGEKQDKDNTIENLNGNPNLDTILKGTSTDKDLYFKTITITPAAAKPSTISYNGKTLKQGETITDGNNGTATVDRENNTITLNNFKGTQALSFDATLADSTLVLEGTNTLSSIVTTQKGLTISGSGSLTVGSIRVPNITRHTANLTINGGAHVTVGTAELTTRAIDVNGSLTVTNGSLTATSASNNVPTVQVGGNASFTGSTVTITNHSDRQGKSGEYSYAVSTGLYVGGTLDIKNAAKVTSTVIGGNAIYAKGDITISGDNTEVKATNDAYKFSAISTNKTVNISDNSTVKAENLKRHQGDPNGDTDPSTGKTYNPCPAIAGKIANKNSQNKLHIVGFTTSSAGSQNPTEGTPLNRDIAPSSVEPYIHHYYVTITRGDAYTTPQVAANYTIAGQTMYVGKYYKTDASGNITEGTAQDYNIFCDSENDFTLNNATISSTGTDVAINTNIRYETNVQHHIKLIGTNRINNTFKHAISAGSNSSTIIIEGVGNASDASLTINGNFLPIYSDGKVIINAEVVIVNTTDDNSFKGLISTSDGKGAFDLGSGYKCYASTSTTGTPLEEFNSANYSTYKYLRVTTQTLETGGGSTHQHTWDTTKWYSVGDDYHARKCTGCDEYDLTNKQAHYAWPDEDKGPEGHTEKCMLCDYKYDQSVIKPHEWTGWWVSDYQPEVHAQRCNCGYQGSTHRTLKYVAINSEQHQKQCPVDGCGYKIEYKTSHVYEEGSNICTECGYDKSAPCNHTGDRVYTNNGDGTHKVTCKACGATIVEKETHEFDPTGACVCGATQSGGNPTPDNPGTIVIIRPAEEEKPAQQPNPSTGANDLVGLAVAAAVAAALGSAALLRKHD